MDEDRASGTARNLGGKVEEGVGRLTGDKQTQLRGKLDQLAGTAQDLYGQTTDAARDTAGNLDKWLRTTIETQPYNGNRGARHRLAPRQNAQAVLIVGKN